MKIGIITFHGAHNYGSMLQNYALQNVLQSMGHTPITINYRTHLQKEMYTPFMSIFKLKDKKRIIISLLLWPYKKSLESKYWKFERFLLENIALTDKEYDDSVSSLPIYDAYVAGSDQIWNLNTRDFDWKYLLDFAPDDSIKISYAASLGPSPYYIRHLHDSKKNKIKTLLNRLDGISVRDIDSAEVLSEILGENRVVVSLDPTLLLTKDVWNSVIPQEKLVMENYIFLYNPYYDKMVYDAAKVLSQKTGLPIYVSNQNVRSSLHSFSFKKKLDAGPWDFLNLIKNAQYVIGRSFHLVAFSIIFQKKFVAVNGLHDCRIKQLLSILKLEVCATSLNRDIMSVLSDLDKIDYRNIQDNLDKARHASMEFLYEKLPV